MGDKRAAEKSLYKDPKRGSVGRSLGDSQVMGDETREAGRMRKGLGLMTLQIRAAFLEGKGKLLKAFMKGVMIT